MQKYCSMKEASTLMELTRTSIYWYIFHGKLNITKRVGNGIKSRIFFLMKDVVKLINNRKIANLKGEVWRDIPEFVGNYMASNKGRIKSVCGPKTKGRILKQYVLKQRGGYLSTSPSLNGKNIVRRVHRLIASAFLGPCPKDSEVHHVDNNPQNNKIDNLTYITKKNHAAETRKLRCVLGYSKDKSKINPWSSYIRVNGSSHRIGCFKTKQLAQQEYSKVFFEMYGFMPKLKEIK